MKNKENLHKVIEEVYNEYIIMDIDKLKKLIENTDVFVRVYNGTKYLFEIDAEYKNEYLVVRINGQLNKMLTIGYAKYFALNNEGVIIENDKNLMF